MFSLQIPKSTDSIIVELSDFSSMCLLQCVPRFYAGDDCRSIHLILYKFMEQPIPKTSDAIVAFDMADLKVRTNLLQLGALGFFPPWPQINDIMYCRRDLATPHKVDICVVRGIILPQYLQKNGNNDVENASGNDFYCGKVLVSKLLSTVNIEK